MFARAARFPAVKDDNLPGPGAFDPRSPESKKKGAFLEKEERFKPAKHDGIDNFGAYTAVEGDLNALRKSRTRAVSMSHRTDEQKLDALRTQLAAQHTKDIKVLEQQLAKQAKELEQLRNVEIELKKEANNRASAEASMKAELKHAKDQLSLLPSLKQKFIDLVEEHATSKTRYTTSMDSLRADLSESEKRLKRSQAGEARLQAENIAKTREVGRLGDELGKVRAEKSKVEEELKSTQRECEAEKTAKEEAETLVQVQKEHFDKQLSWLGKQADVISANASAALALQKQQHEARCAELQINALASENRALRSDRKLLEKQDQIARLVDLVIVLEEEKAFLSDQVDDLQEEIEERELQGLQDANLWRSHSAELAERCIDLAEDLENERKDAVGDADLHEQEVQWLADSLDCEEEQVQHLRGVEEEMVALSREKTELHQEIASQRAELETAYTSISEKATQLQEVETALSISQEECHNLQDQLSSSRSETSALSARLSSTEQHLSSSLDALSASEGQIESLTAEVAGLHEDLIDYLALQETHGELCKTIERLTRTSSLAQEDADELARINADLVGHSNPSQKIRHLDRLRTDLAEIKKKHVATLAELTAAQNQVKNLQSEIAAYRSVDGAPGIKHLQTSRLGPGRSILGHAGNNHVSVRGGNLDGVLKGLHVALPAKGALRISRQRSLHDLR